MLRRLLILAPAALAACATSAYAVYPPAVLGTEAQRIQRLSYSIVPPVGFVSPTALADDDIRLREQPPDNGKMLVYRSLRVERAPAVPEDEPAAVAAQAMAILRERHAKDDLEVRETGTVRLVDRDCPFLVGRISGGAADLHLEVLEFYVPGDLHGLVVSFDTPDGQLAASRAVFEQSAATLRTSLGPPKPGALGALHWHDEQKLGLRLPVEWVAQAGGEGALATYETADGEGLCEVIRVVDANGYDLERLVGGYEADQQKVMPGYSLLTTGWRSISGQRALRFVGVHAPTGESVVVDDLFLARGTTMYRIVFQATVPHYATRRAAIGKALDSLRLQ